MIISEQNSASTWTAETTLATVRFSHVDAAGIIFYPRYLEFLADTWPNRLSYEPPFVLSLQFKHPNRLGDKLKLVWRENSTNGMGWHGYLESDDQKQVAIECSSESLEATAVYGHKIDDYSFRTPTFEIADWMVGPNKKLQLSRYYELINRAVEDWFEKSFNLSFGQLHRIDHHGIPTVSIETCFKNMPTMGTSAHMQIHSRHVGRRSFSVQSYLVCGDEWMVTSKQTFVFVSFSEDAFSSVDIPVGLRKQLVKLSRALQSPSSASR